MTRKTLFALLFLLLAVPAFAQANPQPPSEPQVSAQPEHEAKPKRHQGLQGQLVEESKEAAGEDEEGAFKKSPSVQFVARMTGTSATTAYWLCIVANFAVIAALIAWGMKKAVPAALRNRSAAIQQSLEEARKASEEANRRLSEIESRLARLDQEIVSMRTAAEEEARQEEERIRAAAEEDRRKVVQSAEQEIAAAARSARSQLKAYVAGLAITIAEQKIQIGPNEDQALVRGFAEHLGKGGR